VKKFLIIFALILAFMMTLAISGSAMAAGRDDVMFAPAVNLQSPVKAREEIKVVQFTGRNEMVNYDSEAIVPTGDENAGEDAAGQIEGFFTWAALGTYSGMVTFVIFATEALKKIKWLAAIETWVVSYCVALLTMICANIFTQQATVSSLVLSLFNALIISLAANGLYDGITKKKSAKADAAPDPPAGFEKL